MQNPAKSRTRTYTSYKRHGFALERDTRGMEEICRSPSGFKLQVQQRFLQKFLEDNFKTFKHLLLYHALGSGKSCTAITMAEEYMRINPNGKVLVILPARLRTNFYDELMSDCASAKYISQQDRSVFASIVASAAQKNKIRAAFMRAVNEKYDVMSFEHFRKLAGMQTNLKEWMVEFTKDRFVVIDEVHNLISTASHPTTYKQVVSKNNITFAKKIPALYTHLFRFLVNECHPSSKMIFLTATPVFNNMRHFYELTSILNPSFVRDDKAKVSDCVDALRGYVSFFPGTSETAYPAKEYIEEKIMLTPQIDEVMAQIQAQQVINEDDHESAESEDKDAFFAKERRAGLAIMPGNNPLKSTKAAVRELVRNRLATHAPKIDKLMTNLKAPGKHLIYTNFVESGVNVIAAAFEAAGMVPLKKVLANPKANHQDHKVFAIWDGSTPDVEKQAIKNIANALDNIDGKHLRFIIGSPSIKEGISFKHVQHMHIMDPVWNFATKAQIEGRSVRFCSHVDVPRNHPVLKRKVKIHTYVMMPTPTSEVQRTADWYIYNVVIPSKYRLVEQAERALKRVAIDYFLFRKLHEQANAAPSPIAEEGRSPVNLNANPVFKAMKPAPKEVKAKNTCPKRRRPNIHGKCGDGMVPGKNKNGDKCCYKEKVPRAPKNLCPKPRRPDSAGNCPDGKVKRMNKHNQECCYAR